MYLKKKYYHWQNFIILLIINQLCFFSLANAQTLKIWKEIKINKPLSISTDKQNSLFVSDERGNVNKYDSTGKLILNFSPQKLADVTQLEAWQTVRVFIFYRDLQEFLFLDRFLNPITTYRIPEESIGFAKIATPSADDKIWALDNSDFSLKKYDPKTGLLLIHTSLDLLLNLQNYDINFMREYQNQLFINDKNAGILVFDNLGNYKKTLPYTGLTYIGVQENNLVILSANQLIFFDLYTFSEKKINLPSDQPYLFATQIGDKIISLSENKLIYWKMEE